MAMSLHQRFEIEALCETDIEFRAQVIATCKNDPVFWFNAFAWTFDPRIEGVASMMPFMLFPIQEDFIRFVDARISAGESFGIEKSRDLGVTWLMLGIIVHRWLFHYGFTANVGSMVETKVWKPGDKDTLFWKLDFIVENLPHWMKPLGFVRRQHLTYMKLENPANQSVITGAAPTENFGRSGRASMMFFDELQAWENAEAAWNSASQTTKCRVAVGTPCGMNFYGRLMNPEKGKPALPKFILDWRDDPRKNAWEAYDVPIGTGDISMETGYLTEEFLARAKLLGFGIGWAKDAPKRAKSVHYPWYTYQVIKVFHGDMAWIAQELDRDYKRSVRGVIYPQYNLVRHGRFLYDPDLPLYTAWDVGKDMTAVLWIQYDWRKRRFNLIDYLEAKDKLIEWFVPFITGRVPTDQYGETYTEPEKETIRYHDGWRIDSNFGDPSGSATGQVVDYSPYDVLESYGIEMTTNTRARSFMSRIDPARKFLPLLNVDDVRCLLFNTRMENYRWVDRPDTHNSTSTKAAPVHNDHSHGCTAWEYFCVNIQEIYDDLKQIDPFGQGGKVGDGVVRRMRDYVVDPEDMAVSRGVTGYGD